MKVRIERLLKLKKKRNISLRKRGNFLKILVNYFSRPSYEGGARNSTTGKQYTPNCLDTPVTAAPAEASSGCGGDPVAGKEEVLVILYICV